jgi:putative ABC transport system permease protein
MRGLAAHWVLFRSLNVGAITAHRLRTGLSVAGIALGVMLVFSALLFNGSLTDSFAETERDVRGAASIEVAAIGSGAFDAALVDRARGVPGVTVAAPLLVDRAEVRGPRGRAEVLAVSYDDQLRKLAPDLEQTRAVRDLPESAGVIVTRQLLDSVGLAADGTIRVVAYGVETPFAVVAVTSADVANHLYGGSFVGLPLRFGQRIFRERQEVSSILIRTPETGERLEALRRRLQDALGTGVRVIYPEQDVQELERSSEQVRAISVLFSTLTLLISAYLMFNTVTMTVHERRRELATLLVLGDRRHRVVLRLLTESALIGAAGVVVGLPLGWALGQYLSGTAPPYLQDAYGYRPYGVVSAWLVAAAAGAGIGTAVVGALMPILTVLRLPPVEGLRRLPQGERPTSRWAPAAFLAVGLAFAAAGAAGVGLAPQAAPLVLALVTTGGALAAPAAFASMLRLLSSGLMRPWLGRGTAVASVVGANLAEGRGRTVATISAATFSLAMVVAVGTLTTGVQDTVARYASKFRNLDLVVTASADPYASLLSDQALGPRIATVPSVAAVYPHRNTFISWGGRRVLLVGMMPDEVRQLDLDFDSGARAAALSGMAAGGMLISAQNARLDHLRPGDPVTLHTPAGDRTYQVAGVVEYWSWPEGAFIVSDTTFVSDFQEAQVNAFDVRLAAGASVSQAERDIRRLAPGVTVTTGADATQTVLDQESALFAPFFDIRNVLVAVAILAVFNSMMIAALQRTSEVGVLRAIGLRPDQLGRVFVLEAVGMLAIALAVGTAFGIVLYRIGIPLIAGSTGLTVRWEITPGPLLLAAGAAAGIAFLGSVYPAHMASRLSLLEALAYE